jgi:hypothetical protein
MSVAEKLKAWGRQEERKKMVITLLKNFGNDKSKVAQLLGLNLANIDALLGEQAH